MKQKKAVKMLSALAQETRVDVFKLLMQEGPEGLPAGVIAELLEVPGATLSFHLSQLTSAGLIKSSKDGRVIRYSAKYKVAKELLRFLTENSYKKRKQELPEKEKSEELDDKETA